MVMRWKAEVPPIRWLEVEDGDIIAYSDYQSLKDALREALDGWEDWLAHTPGAQPEWDRIEFLRKQYLDT